MATNIKSIFMGQRIALKTKYKQHYIKENIKTLIHAILIKIIEKHGNVHRHNVNER